MELIIAVIGGLFFLFKFLGEKSADKSHNDAFQKERYEEQSSFEMWAKTVTDDDLEERCKKVATALICGGDGSDKVRSVGYLRENLSSIWDGLPAELRKMIGNNIDFAVTALMAHFGKLPYDLATEGRVCRVYSGDHRKRIQEEEQWWNRHYFYILIDSILREKMPQAYYSPLRCDYYPRSGDPFYYTTPAGLGGKLQKRNPAELKSPVGILYYWHPGICFRNSKI